MFFFEKANRRVKLIMIYNYLVAMEMLDKTTVTGISTLILTLSGLFHEISNISVLLRITAIPFINSDTKSISKLYFVIDEFPTG